MPVVTMPDGQQVEMPENPSEEQLRQLQGILQAGQGQAQPSAQPLAPPQPPSLGAGDYAKAAVTGVGRGALGLPALVSDAMNYGLKKYGEGEWTANTPMGMGARAMRSISTAVPKMFGAGSAGELLDTAIPKETDSRLRLTQNIGEGLGGAALPGGNLTALQRAMLGGSSGLGAGIGEEALGPLGGLAGAVLGGGIAAGAIKYENNPRAMLKQAMENMDSKGFAKARRLEKTLVEEGIPHLKSQLLGPGSTLDELVAQASEHPSVMPKLRKQLGESGEKAKTALDKWRFQELPNEFKSSRERLTDVSKQAGKTVGTLKAEANQAFVRNLPEGAAAEAVAPQDIESLVSRLGQIADDPNFAGQLSPDASFIKGIISDITSVNGTMGVRQGDLEGLSRSLGTRAAKEGVGGAVARRVKEALQETVPDYAQARAAKTSTMRDVVNPAQEGLIGEAANAKSPAALTSRFFPKSMTQVTEIKNFGQQVGVDALGSVLDEHIGKVANTSFSKPLTGPEQINRFTKELMGTEAQRKNLYAALDTLSEGKGADPRKVRVGFAKLVRALETFNDAKVGSKLNRVELEQRAGQNVTGTLFAPQSRLSRIRQLSVTKRTYEKLGKIVTDPDGLKELEKIAMSKDPKVAAMFIRMNMIEAGDQGE